MLKDQSLLHRNSYINGQWVKGNTIFPVINPYDGKKIVDVSGVGKKETKETIEWAQKAFDLWKNMRPKERGSFLQRWGDLMNAHRDDLATLLTYESGKPYEQSMHEMMGNDGFFNWYAHETQRLHGFTPISPDPNRRFMTIKQPVGVVGVITPWNFPSVIPIQKCLPALAAGCTVVLKPAEDTPLSVLALAELADRAAIPHGVFNVITCYDPSEVGEELTHNSLVRKITFTGSTEIGKKILGMSGSTVKSVTMELGGNCPAIIFDDADIDKAVQSTFWFKFYNAGQCCNNINRFFIHTRVYDQFINKFHQMMKKHLFLGNGMNSKTSMGPLINEQGIRKCEELVNDALGQGAVALAGGRGSTVGPLFYEPTLLTNMDRKMRIYREEVFGPIAPIYSFSTEEEVITMANDTNYGLAAYVFSEHIGRVYRVAESLEAGSVGINTTDVTSELLPFGGWKESGIGRENALIGSMDGYCENKSIIIAGMCR